jgi:anti-sigma regulatory factor (Ser/Thr protein kinase)
VAAIARAGIDVDAAQLAGSLVMADAAESLAKHLVDDWPDAGVFATEIGGLIRRLVDSGRRVRIYGEMVAMLWEAGNVAAAIELETLWNDLGRRLPFSLFCAYHADTVADDEHADSFRRMCHLHSAVVTRSAVVATALETFVVARAEDARSFPCELYAPSAARRFVADTLTVWGREHVIDDASLVVAELATNAVVHARSEFIVAVSSDDDAVRLSVRDASPALPTVRDPHANSVSGRGLMLVAAIARRWGIELVNDGKVVWAELGPR